MKARGIFGEATRDLLTGTARAGILALVLIAISVALATIDILAIHAQQEYARQFESSGASIRVLGVEQNIDPVSCDALIAAPAITAAGALKPGDAITVTAVPHNPIPSYTGTLGLAGVLGVDSTREGVWLPTELADSLGINVGDSLLTTRGNLVVADTFTWPDDGRDARLRYAIITPSLTTGSFDECWAHTWPLATAADDLIRTAASVTNGASETLNITQINNTYGAVYDAYLAYQNRPTKKIWAGTILAAAILGFVAARRRRLEYAGALHAGQNKTDLFATTILETLAAAAAAAIITIGAIHLITGTLGYDNALALADVQLNGPLLMMIGTPLGSAVGVALTAERHLFRYFKDRN